MRIKKIASFNVKEGVKSVRYSDLNSGIQYLPADGIINIKSEKVRIAGFGVNESSLYKIDVNGTPYSIGSVNSIYLSNAGIITSRSIGGSKGTLSWAMAISDKFGVTVDGTLYAMGGHFAGTIEAKSGKIGTTLINEDGSIVSANGGFRLDANGDLTISHVGGSQLVQDTQTALSTANDAKGKISTVANDLSNLSIGGRNLFEKSGKLTSDDSCLKGAGSNLSITDRTTGTDAKTGSGQYIACKISNPGGGGVYLGGQFGNYTQKLKGGEVYTVSVYAKASKNCTDGAINVEWMDRVDNVICPNYSTEWQRYIVTGRARADPTGGYIAIAICFYPPANTFNDTVFYISSPKVEIGNRPTDWSPAPEDVESGISNANDKASQAHSLADTANNIANNALNQANSAIDQANAGMNKWLVTKYNSGKSDNSITTIPLLLINKLVPESTMEYSNAFSDFFNYAPGPRSGIIFSDEKRVAYAVTYVNFNADTTVSNLALFTDDGGTLYLNGSQIIRNGSCGSSTGVSATFKKGWNVIEAVIHNGMSFGGFALATYDSSAKTYSALDLTKLPNFQRMDCYCSAFSGQTAYGLAVNAKVLETSTSLKYAIYKIDVQYAQSDSNMVAPKTGWSTTAPPWEDGKYMWQQTVTTYGDSRIAVSDPTCISGAEGAPGSSVALTGYKAQYQAGTSGTTAPTGTWSDTVVPTTTGQFLWTRIQTSFSNGNTYTSYSVSAHGQKGDTGLRGAVGPQGIPGTSVTILSTDVTYQVGGSATVPPSGVWHDDIQQTQTGQYLWTKMVTNFSDGQSITAYSVAAHGATGAQGLRGIQGEKGDQGIPGNDGYSPTVTITKNEGSSVVTITDKNGPHSTTVLDGAKGTPGMKGADGKTSYFHVKYSNDGGKTLTANNGETVGDYIGTRTDFVEMDSTNVADYTWAKIKGETGARGLQGIQGVKGDQGIPGQNGRTSYFHVKYSSVANPTNANQLTETPNTYIGTYVDFTEADSTDPSKYTWTQFKGSQGVKGDQGIAGKNGADGKTSYLHIAYANSADGSSGFDVSNGAGKLYIGQYTDFTQTDSTDHTKYTWSKIKGEQGERGLQGIQGVKGDQGIPGQNGKTSYFHIKYSSVANPTSPSQLTETPSTYIGTYVDFTEADSTDPKTYSWTQFKGSQGAKGDQGIAGKNGADGKTSYLHIAYANSSDGSKDFDISNGEGKMYIGQYTDFTQADSTDRTKYTWTKIKGETGPQGEKGDTGPRGSQGLQGPKGDQGIAGKNGADGRTSYLHIAYANSADGSNGFDISNGEGKLYIGQYTDFTQADSTDRTKYIWSKIKGEQGPQGVQGAKGADGKTSYFHIKYSTVAAPISSTQLTETPSTYIGTYVDYTETDSTDPSKYKWSRFEGIKGDQGIPGVNGANGKTSYLHVAYANDITGASNFSTTDPTGRAYLGQYTDFTQADSTDYTKYTWSKIKGEQGPQGIQGVKGNDGKTTYFHIKYSSVANPTNANQMTETPDTYIGTYTDFNASDSSDPKAYTWTQFKGSQGAKGDQGIPGKNGVDGKTYYLHIAYANSADGSSGFSTTDSKGKLYLGQCTDLNSADPTSPSSYSWSLIKGDKGLGVKAVKPQYYLSTSNSSQAGGSWTETQPAWTSGKYIWTRSKVTWDDNSVTYSSPILANGINSANDKANQAYNLANTANGKISTVANDLSNLSIGGRNLFEKSGKLTSDDSCLKGAGSNLSITDRTTGTDAKTESGQYIACKISNPGGGGVFLKGLFGNYAQKLKGGEVYTVSVYAKADKNYTVGSIAVEWMDRVDNVICPNYSTEWQRYIVTGRARADPTGGYIAIAITFYPPANTFNDTVFYISSPKVEIGNRPTAWSPAPEDVDASIADAKKAGTDAQTAASNAQSTANTAVANAKTAQDTANSANEKATATDLLVSNWCNINDKTLIDGSKIYTGTITADKLNINEMRGTNGVIYLKDGTFDYGNGKLKWDGSSLTINGNGTFSGTINAKSGEIGGWKISNNSLKAEGSGWAQWMISEISPNQFTIQYNDSGIGIGEAWHGDYYLRSAGTNMASYIYGEAYDLRLRAYKLFSGDSVEKFSITDRETPKTPQNESYIEVRSNYIWLKSYEHNNNSEGEGIRYGGYKNMSHISIDPEYIGFYINDLAKIDIDKDGARIRSAILEDVNKLNFKDGHTLLNLRDFSLFSNYIEFTFSDIGQNDVLGVTCWKSDKTLKTNIIDTNVNGSYILKNIEFKQFDWIDTGKHESIGVIAQDLEKIDENLVLKIKQSNGSYTYQINPNEFATITAKSLQEQITRIDNIESNASNIASKIENTKNELLIENQKLKARLDYLEAKVKYMNGEKSSYSE